MALLATDRAEMSARSQAKDASDYVLDEQVGHLLRRAHQRHAAIFLEMIDDAQLTPLQFGAIMKLADVGQTSQNQLGRLTAMDAATMQGVIKRLIARGLVVRGPDPDDRRRLLLTLSANGVALAGQVVQRGLEISAKTLEPLSASERETFLKLLARLSD